ncbi:MAG: TIM barrel protein [Planctomycetaceae bacterium]|nr:TIM barrel protein [Planctomycetaceae bacterium]
MDVFLEDLPSKTGVSVLSRLSVARPLQARSFEELATEAVSLERHGIRFVAVRRQQAHLIGELAIREVLDDHGISVSCLGFAGGFTGAIWPSFDDAVADVQRAVETASLLNAASIIVLPGNRGLHTYNHAERIVRDGLLRSAVLVADSGIRLFVPTDTLLTDSRDCFRTSRCLVEWIGQLRFRSIRPMIVVRGSKGAWRLPDGWRECLANGGCLRICHRCESYEQNARLLNGIIRFLQRTNPASD